MTAESNKPIRTFRLRGVKAAVFENKAGENTFHKVSLQKIYREGEEWKTTPSLGRDDLPVARLLLDRAWQFILDLESGAMIADEHPANLNHSEAKEKTTASARARMGAKRNGENTN